MQIDVIYSNCYRYSIVSCRSNTCTSLSVKFALRQDAGVKTLCVVRSELHVCLYEMVQHVLDKIETFLVQYAKFGSVLGFP